MIMHVQVETRKYKRVLDDVPNNVLQLVIKDGKGAAHTSASDPSGVIMKLWSRCILEPI